jgi:hypothetical protein
MLIRIIKNVNGEPVNNPPYHEKPDTALAFVAAGLAIEVPGDTHVVIREENGRASADTVDSQGQVIRSSRPAPNAMWTIVPEKRISTDWVQAPYLSVKCTSCGNRHGVQGPKAFEFTFDHCTFVTEPKVGNYVKVTQDVCPQNIAKEYQRLYKLWAKENKSASGNYPQEDLYGIAWSRSVEKQDRIVAQRLDRTPFATTDEEKPEPSRT